VARQAAPAANRIANFIRAPLADAVYRVL